jgi:hypothetical protein
VGGGREISGGWVGGGFGEKRLPRLRPAPQLGQDAGRVVKGG